jgi:hypothetical protein
MSLRRGLLILVALLAVAGVAQAVAWWPQLPERVASHFDLSNRVDGWMGRTAFLVLTVGLQVFLAVLFIALPVLLERLPDSLINLPDKDYWLAPARRSGSLAHMSSGLLAIGAATLMLLLVVFQGIFELNARLARDDLAGGRPADGAPAGGATAAGATLELSLPLPFLVVMALYLLTVAGVLAGMFRRFRNPDEKSSR